MENKESDTSYPDLREIGRQYWQMISPWLNHPIFKNKNFPYIIGLLLFFSLVLVVTCERDKHYVNNQVGYELTIPRGWSITELDGRTTVVLEKKKRPVWAAKTTIRIHAELGNPYGATPVNYIYNGIIPAYRDSVAVVEGKNFKVRMYPFSRQVNNQGWGVASFIIDYDELYVIYATSVGEYTLSFVLTSPKASDQERDERALYKIISSLKINVKQRRNVFIEQDVGKLFFDKPAEER